MVGNGTELGKPTDKKAVLLLVFNRPALTSQVLAEIVAYNPSTLYVSGDGPRDGNSLDESRCQEVRDLFADANFSFPVVTNFSESNKGCRDSVADGITWFFGQEDDGIILEDDCLPSPQFFNYAANLLEKYRDEPRIWGIGGANSYGIPISQPENAYSFTSYALIWGWATWADRWKHYDRDLATWPLSRRLKSKFRWANWREMFVFTTLLSRQKKGKGPDTWDYQWTWTVLFNRGLCVFPKQNLIENIGFGSSATHPVSEQPSNNSSRTTTQFGQQPFRVERDSLTDNLVLTYVYQMEKSFVSWFKNKVRNVLRKTLKKIALQRKYEGTQSSSSNETN